MPPAPSSFPVPASLGARLLRQAVFVDAELTSGMLRSQLLHRVMLFAPDAELADLHGDGGSRPARPALEKLEKQLEGAVKSLLALVQGAGGGDDKKA